MQPISITHWLETAASFFTRDALPEWAAVALVPLLACIIGAYFVRLISGLPPVSHLNKTLDFISPLLTPIFALSLAISATALFRAAGVESILLLLLIKLTATWIAIELIRQMIAKRIAGWFIALAFIPITILKLFGLLDITIEVLSDMHFSLGTVELSAYVVLKGIIAMIALQWVASLSVKLLDTRLQGIQDLRASNRALVLKLFSILVYCVVFLFAMQLLGINLTALGVFGGALGVGLGFGLQKIASNFISGIILLFEKSIEIGDLIELADGTVGYVRQTFARYTRLEMVNGKEILIPNEEFISQRVISWTHSNKKAQIEIVLSVSYDADVALARRLMMQAAEGYKWMLPGSETSCYLTSFGDSGIELRMQFWVRDVTRGRMAPKSDVMFGILEAFRAHNIIIPYPQREVRVVNTSPLDENTMLGADA